jgi:peptidoglycan/xylan/chitin deacetylase (PgdA/CDA1 family)
MLKLSLACFLAISTVSVGCSSSDGGQSGVGGSTSTGGATTSPTGGNGGTSASGGTSSSGGIGAGGKGSGEAATGGSTSNSGGTVSAGGAAGAGAGGSGSGSGGASAAGGVTAKGGTSGGGASDSGGVTSTGGATSSGGGSSIPVGASGYPAAGASGQAKPTGSGTTVTVLPWADFKGAVSFTFDDANQTQIDNYPALQKQNDKGNNVRYTFYLITGKTTEMASSVWPQALKDGHELANHTKSHLQTGDVATLGADADAAETFLRSTFGVTAYSLAAPYGTATYQSVAVGRFLTSRGVGDGGIAMTDNPDNTATPSSSPKFNLPCYIPAAGASAAEMEASLNTTVSAGKWKTMLVHGFSGGSDGAYQPVDIKEFTATVAWAKAQGTIWLDSVVNVSAYWIAGYKFSKIAPTTSGNDKTWTWKTSDFSDHFPPGKYLRVKTDGGTLKQGNTTLTWDEHGYYEVSLDAGALTLSP